MNGSRPDGEATGAAAVDAAVVGVEVVRAWPRRHEAVRLRLPAGATVADAVRACGLPLEGIAGQAVFGELAAATRTLRDGDRVELLEALRIDPKDARRRRARP
jgi:putative ubiquitin-RnfH superfamily antitoxin RatB of RatAB toxin-antitoxin module